MEPDPSSAFKDGIQGASLPATATATAAQHHDPHAPAMMGFPSPNTNGTATDQIVLALERTVREEEEEARLLRELIERTHLERQRKLDGILQDADEAQRRVSALQCSNEELVRDLESTRKRREQLEVALNDLSGVYSEDEIMLVESTLQTLRAHLELERRNPAVVRRPDQVVLLLRDQVDALLQTTNHSSRRHHHNSSDPIHIPPVEDVKRRLHQARMNQRKLLQELTEVKATMCNERRALERLFERRQKKTLGNNNNNSPARSARDSTRSSGGGFAATARGARGYNAGEVPVYPLQRSLSGATDHSGVSATRSSRAPTLRTASSGTRVSPIITCSARVSANRQRTSISGEGASSGFGGGSVQGSLPVPCCPSGQGEDARRGRSRSSGGGGGMDPLSSLTPLPSSRRKPPMRHGEMVRELRNRLRLLQQRAQTAGREKYRLQLEHLAQETDATLVATNQLRDKVHRETQYRMDLRDACWGLRSRIHDLRTDLKNVSYSTLGTSPMKPVVHPNTPLDGMDATLPLSERCNIPYHVKVVHERAASCHALDQTLHRILAVLNRAATVGGNDGTSLPCINDVASAMNKHHASSMERPYPTNRPSEHTFGDGKKSPRRSGDCRAVSRSKKEVDSTTWIARREEPNTNATTAHLRSADGIPATTPLVATGGALIASSHQRNRPPVLSPRRSTGYNGSPLPAVAAYPGALNPEAARLEQMEKLVGNLKMKLYKLKEENAAFLKLQAVRSKSSHRSSGPATKSAHRAARIVRQNFRGA